MGWVEDGRPAEVRRIPDTLMPVSHGRCYFVPFPSMMPRAKGDGRIKADLMWSFLNYQKCVRSRQGSCTKAQPWNNSYKCISKRQEPASHATVKSLKDKRRLRASCFAHKRLEIRPEPFSVQTRHLAQIFINHVVTHAHAP